MGTKNYTILISIVFIVLFMSADQQNKKTFPGLVPTPAEIEYLSSETKILGDITIDYNADDAELKNKIEESEKALQEAQILLKESQLAFKNYKNNSKNIISTEKQKALDKSKNYLNKIEEDIKRKEILMDKEIDYLQHNVKASIKRQILEITINSVQNLISNTKNIQASDMIFKGFLEKIPGTISNSSYKKD